MKILPEIDQFNRSVMGLLAFLKKKTVEYSVVWLAAGRMLLTMPPYHVDLYAVIYTIKSY
jgi:hypothetical protein